MCQVDVPVDAIHVWNDPKAKRTTLFIRCDALQLDNVKTVFPQGRALSYVRQNDPELFGASYYVSGTTKDVFPAA